MTDNTPEAVEPDALTIDFAKVFAGIEYPKDSVTVIVNEKLGYQVHTLEATVADAVARNDEDEIAALEASLDALRQEAKNYAYTFHLTGVSRELRNDLTDQVTKEFEVETDMFGRVVKNAEADKAYKSRRWALHTEKIVGPRGATVVAPTPENIAAFLASAPDRAIFDIDQKILELSGNGASDGFDSIIRDPDFLSER